MNSADDLLSPTLEERDNPTGFDDPFQPQSLVYGSFFGGPLVAAFFFGWNFRKLGEPKKAPIAVLLFLALGSAYFLYPFVAAEDYLALTGQEKSDLMRTPRLINRAVTTLFAVIVAVLQNRRFELFTASGGTAKKAFWPIVIVTAIVTALTFALLFLVALFLA